MEETHPFITYLTQTLVADRGALAALRRGLGQPPGFAPEMLRFVVPFLPERPSAWHERTLYMLASLFALHPAHTGEGNLGDHFARLKSEDNTALERRFTALLAAHPDELDIHLRRAVAMFKSKDIPVNWDQLLKDCLAWSHPERQARVRRRWAMRFWRVQPVATSESETEQA